jgi:hypothetical protein
MNLEIHSVEDKGNLDSERIWLRVTSDTNNLAYYAIADTTYTDNGKISNELRHIYWFPGTTAKTGDWLCVYSKNGTNSSAKNNDGTTTHTFFWRLGRTVWNKGKDQAVLFQLTTWTSKAV